MLACGQLIGSIKYNNNNNNNNNKVQRLQTSFFKMHLPN
jgi:hypothetical protein